MVTAKTQSEDIVEALKIGANDYVTKPVDLSIVLARVNNQVARRRAEAAIRKANESLLNAMTHLEQRVALEKKIAHLAHHDMLTGLPNRFAFDERLNAARQLARESGSQLSLLFIDLDGFKNVNDALGHAVGDEFLKEVAARLTNVLGASDFCSRLGGDEFAVVHVSKDVHTTAGSLAQAIISAVGSCNYIAGHQVFVGASVGISVLEGGDNNSATLLKRADLAMYRAKADGRGVYRFFETKLDDQAKLRRSLELDLRRAAENGDFQLYYQPIVGLKERTVAGFEALMRWNHPTRGFVPPSEFIPLAEETGLIVPIGEWALRQACADAAQWPNNLRVAINLSPVQFRTTASSLWSSARSALPDCRPNGSNSRSRKASCCGTAHKICLSWVGCARSARGLRSTISGRGIPAWATFARSSSTRSRSISLSFRKCSGIPKAARSCGPPSAWEEASAFARRLKASRAWISSNTSSARAAPRCKAFCSARRNRRSKFVGIVEEIGRRVDTRHSAASTSR